MGKKTKKKKLFTSKQLFIIGIAAIVLLLVMISIALNPTGKKKEAEVKEESGLVKDFKNEKDVIEYYESVYYSTEKSSAEGYDIDIYVSFKHDLYENDESQEIWFKSLYEKIAYVTDKKSFRLIDEAKNIYIEVKCTSGGISEVRINGELDYFRKIDSKKSKDKNFKAEVLDLSIDADVLKELIDQRWNVKNVDLGSKESTYYKYDVYFEEGYEIRTIQGKLYNIVFTKKFNGPVVGGYNVGTSQEKIKAFLGTTYEEGSIIGYKTKDFYVWFSSDEISIYPIYKTDYKDFEQLAKKYNENRNANEFMYKITDIWPDYDLYEYNENYVKISYANKGVQFEYSVEYPIGIKLYENYTGSLRDEIDNYPNIFYSFDKNLTGEREVARRETKIFYDDYDEDDPIHYSSKFQLLMHYDGQKYSSVKIKSIDGSYPNNEFEDYVNIYTYVWADDSHLVYSIQEDGIYLYDAENRTTTQIASGKETFEIKSYHRPTNTMVYDDTRIKVDF